MNHVMIPYFHKLYFISSWIEIFYFLKKSVKCCLKIPTHGNFLYGSTLVLAYKYIFSYFQILIRLINGGVTFRMNFFQNDYKFEKWQSIRNITIIFYKKGPACL